MTHSTALTIAGSDCSAGAGIQADLKTFSSYKIHGITALTCIVAETPATIQSIHPLPLSVVRDQLELLLETYPIGAIKTGMLYSEAHIHLICDLLEAHPAPILVDPIMTASTGDKLLFEGARHAMIERLFPLSSFLTPNIPEACQLLGRQIDTCTQQQEAARELAQQFQVGCYLKGGHRIDQGQHQDFFAYEQSLYSFQSPHLEIQQSHGTGCTFAAAFTAGLAQKMTPKDAAASAHQFTLEALKESLSWKIPGKEQRIHHLNQTQKNPPIP